MIDKMKYFLQYINNPLVYISLGVTTLLIIIFVILLNLKKQKWLLWVGIPTICNALIMILTKLSLPLITKILLKLTEKETILNVITPFINTTLNSLFNYALILLVIGIIMIITYILIRKHSKE